MSTSQAIHSGDHTKRKYFDDFPSIRSVVEHRWNQQILSNDFRPIPLRSIADRGYGAGFVRLALRAGAITLG